MPPSVLNPGADSPSIYEMQLQDAIKASIENLKDRKRLTPSMDKMVTRAIFHVMSSSTLSNKEVMDILTGEPIGSHSSAESDSLIRHFRQPGNERSLKIGSTRRLIVRLFTEALIPNEDAARLWYYALIHYAAIEAVISDKKEREELWLKGMPLLGDDQVDGLLLQADKILIDTLDAYLVESDLLWQERRPGAEKQRILDHSVYVWLGAAKRPGNPILNRTYLLEIGDELGLPRSD